MINRPSRRKEDVREDVNVKTSVAKISCSRQTDRIFVLSRELDNNYFRTVKDFYLNCKDIYISSY